MTLGWNDRFYYGMFSGRRVRSVWNTKPSYIVWTMCYTSNRFTPEVVEKIIEYVARGPNDKGLHVHLVNTYNEKFMGGPW